MRRRSRRIGEVALVPAIVDDRRARCRATTTRTKTSCPPPAIPPPARRGAAVRRQLMPLATHGTYPRPTPAGVAERLQNPAQRGRLSSRRRGVDSRAASPVNGRMPSSAVGHRTDESVSTAGRSARAPPPTPRCSCSIVRPATRCARATANAPRLSIVCRKPRAGVSSP